MQFEAFPRCEWKLGPRVRSVSVRRKDPYREDEDGGLSSLVFLANKSLQIFTTRTSIYLFATWVRIPIMYTMLHPDTELRAEDKFPHTCQLTWNDCKLSVPEAQTA